MLSGAVAGASEAVMTVGKRPEGFAREGASGMLTLAGSTPSSLPRHGFS